MLLEALGSISSKGSKERGEEREGKEEGKKRGQEGGEVAHKIKECCLQEQMKKHRIDNIQDC